MSGSNPSGAGSGIAVLAVSPGTHRAGREPASKSNPTRDGVTRLGDQLRTQREHRGATLEQASDATRIRTTYLEALERHDWETLPADVFTRGYLRSYAEYLGLDQEHLLKVYARERRIAGVDGASTSGGEERKAARAFLERLAKTQGVETRRVGPRIKWIALGLSGAAVGALAVWTCLHLLAPGRSESTAIEVPARAERASAVTPPPEVAPAANQLPTPPSEPPAQAERGNASHLKVPEFGVGTDVIGHRLVGRGDRFREGTIVWFWTSVLDGRPGDKIQHVWLHEGRSIAVAELRVNGAHWRTQSRRPLPEGSTGNWTVEARDPEGRVLASVGFACVAAD